MVKLKLIKKQVVFRKTNIAKNFLKSIYGI